jgi:hypothetical protein
VLPAGVRAVVTDLDGTIVRADGSVSAATSAAARALRAAGIPLVAATARTPAGLTVLGPLLADVTMAVCCNGAIGLGRAGAAVRWQECLSQQVVSDLVGLLTAVLPGAGLGSYDGRGWALSPEYYAARGRRPRGGQRVLGVPEICRRAACALAVCHPDLPAPGLAGLLTASGLLDGRATISYGADDVVDIAPAGVDKGTGVRRALESLRIQAAAAVGFGDGHNDLPMVPVVGRFVAMADAGPQLREVADEVTQSIAADGFAGWLSRAGLDLGPATPQPRM